VYVYGILRSKIRELRCPEKLNNYNWNNRSS